MSKKCGRCGVNKGVGKAPGCVCGRVGRVHCGHGAVVGGKLYCFGCNFSPCIRNIDVIAAVVEGGRADVPSSLAMEVPCASLLWCLGDEYFCPWWGHGVLVVVKRPVYLGLFRHSRVYLGLPQEVYFFVAYGRRRHHRFMGKLVSTPLSASGKWHSHVSIAFLA